MKIQLYRQWLIYFAIIVINSIRSQHDTTGKEFLVIDNDRHMITDYASCALRDGGFIITWVARWTYKAQRYDKYGNMVNLDLGIDIDGYNGCDITALQDGGFLICVSQYFDMDIPPDPGDVIYHDDRVLVKKFDREGKPVGSETQIYQNNNGTGYYFPSICSLSDGGYVIAFFEFSEDSCLIIQKYNVYENKVGPECRIHLSANTATYFYPDYNYRIKILPLPGGGYIVSWYDGENTACWQWFDRNGHQILKNVQILPDKIYDPFIDLTWSKIGEIILGFTKHGLVMNKYDHNVEIIDSTINIYSPPSNLNTYTRYHRICQLANGDLFSCWVVNYNHLSPPENIYGLYHSPAGEPKSDVFQVDTDMDYCHIKLDVCTLSKGGFVIIFYFYDYYHEDYRINAKFFKSDSIIQPLHDFNLFIPNNGRVLETVNPKFIWQRAGSHYLNLTWEPSYTLYIDETDRFENPIIINAYCDTSYTLVDPPLTPGRIYYWKILAQNLENDSLWSSTTGDFYVTHTATMVKDDNRKAPKKYSLETCCPNPFNSSTVIPFRLQNPSHVIISVYNLQGKKVMVLANGNFNAGSHRINFDAGNYSSGIYFIQAVFSTNEVLIILNQKVVLIK